MKKRDRWASSEDDEDLANKKIRPDQQHVQPIAKRHGLDAIRLRHDSMLHGCRSLGGHYELLNRISEGSFGCVYRGRSKETGRIVALKSFKIPEKLVPEGFPTSALREISSLLSLTHPNVIEVIEVVVDDLDRVFMVMEYIEHELGVLLKNNKPEFSVSEKKRLILQIIEGVEYIHSNDFLHRDLKAANLLYTNDGRLKICDFGLAKRWTSKAHTDKVATLWYRAPELIMQQKDYTPAIDMWSVGCIFGEILLGTPLFHSDSDWAALNDICKLVGTPTLSDYPTFSQTLLQVFKIDKFPNYPSSWRAKFPLPSRSFDPGALTECGLDLLKGLLTIDPSRRLTAAEACKHPYFRESPIPQNIDFMPTAPETNLSVHRRRDSSEDDEEGIRTTRARINVSRYLRHLKD